MIQKNIPEIKNIYKLSLKNKDNYKNLFGSNRPNLVKLYKIYNEAIKKSDVDLNYLKDSGISIEDINDNLFINNRKNVDLLKSF